MHVVVVDPGVGTSRRPILVHAAGQYFVAPDNGVLSLIYAREKHQVRAITAERFFRQPVSRTFHGRDIFAPVAAHLARGVPPPRFGKIISDYERGDFAEPTPNGPRRWTGRVLKVDRFGNLITNFAVDEFSALESSPFNVTTGRRRITACVRSYAEGPPGGLFLIAGSSGFFEVAANQASAAKLTGCKVGAVVRLTAPCKRLSEQFLRSDQAIADLHAVRALDRAGGAIAATHLANLFRQPQEMLPAQGELAVEIGVGEIADGVGNGHALRALSAALLAHAAVQRADLTVQLASIFWSSPREFFRHRPEVHLQLVLSVMLGMVVEIDGILDHPLERGERATRVLHLRLFGGFAGAGRRHDLHRHQAEAGVAQLLQSPHPCWRPS